MFTRYMTLLLESIRTSNFGVMSLDEEYPPLKVSTPQLANTLEATNLTVSQWSKVSVSKVLAELNHNFAPAGITFEEEQNPNISANYSDSGIVWAEIDQETKLIYVYVNKKFLRFLISKDISRKEFIDIAKDLYSQLAHEETHRHQFDKAKVTLKSNLPIINSRAANKKYLQNIHEIDAFARQFASELFKDMSYERAVRLLKQDSPELGKYKAYAIYKELVGNEAIFCVKNKQKNPDLKLTSSEQQCIFTWNKFRQRTIWFLASLNRNYFADSASDISESSILIENNC